MQVTGPNSNSDGGDSGGPIYYGQSAYGMISTSSTAAPPNNLYNFGAISFAETDLQFTTLTK